MTRVVRSSAALYSDPRTLRKRRRCGGHLADPHWIEAGEQAVWSSLPPNSEIGNEGWWHAVYCMDCCPADCDPRSSEPCHEEIHSLDYFRAQQVDSYWIVCTKVGPHDEHEDSNTGAHWPREVAPTPGPETR